MRSALALALTLAAVALAAALPAPATAATPIPWCGPDNSAADRLPDDTTGYAVHVIYAFPSDAQDRFAAIVPRLAGDAAAIDAWWRERDPTRAPRFDLHAFACASTFGRLDVSRVQLPQPTAYYANPRRTLPLVGTDLAGSLRFGEPDKRYLVYYDGTVDYDEEGVYCGIGGGTEEGGPQSLAMVMLRACALDTDDAFRALVAAHELIHSMGAVPLGAPNACAGDRGHVCDHGADILAPGRVGRGFTLADRQLDVNRDDYYGHGAPGRIDVRNSLFLERLDGPDRAAPTPPAGLVVRGRASGGAQLSWAPSSDDVGPVRYWLYADGRLLRRDLTTRAFSSTALDVGETVEFGVRAEDTVGHLTRVVTIRFKVGFGIVDASGRVVRDTVAPGAVTRVRVTKTARSVTLRWAPAVERVGLSGYRVTTSRGGIFVRRPTATIPRRLLGTRGVAISAVDRAGNIGAAVGIAPARLR